MNFDNGQLNEMLRQVGINDVGTFVNQFRSQVNQEMTKGQSNSSAQAQQPDLISMGSSFLNQLGGNSGAGSAKKQSGGTGDLFGGAMSAYKMFSGGNKSGSSADGGANTNDLMGNAMKVYRMFSGGKGTSSTGASGGGLFDNIGATMENAQQMHSLMKKLDRNGDGKITIDDIQLILQGLGLGSVSPQISKALFKAVDRNQNGELDLTDVMALAAIVSKLNSRFGSSGVNQTQHVPQN